MIFFSEVKEKSAGFSFPFQTKGPFLLFHGAGIFLMLSLEAGHWELHNVIIRAAEHGLFPFAKIIGKMRFPVVGELLQLPPISSPNHLFLTYVTLSGF